MRTHCLNPYCARPFDSPRQGEFCSTKCMNDDRIRRFRSGTNAECIDCGRESMGGGAWCYSCWSADDRNARNKVVARRLSVWKGVAA